MKWNGKTIRQIRNGYFSARYFLRTQEVLISQNNWSHVTMQVFQKRNHAVLCGIEEVKSLLKTACGIYRDGKWKSMWKKLTVDSLQDGDIVSPYEPVMHITGPYLAFVHLESLYLGILARRTLVATNSRLVMDAVKGKPVYFFADRFDHFLNQDGDGYAAHIGGISGVCTQAHASWWEGEAIGTMPHAFIAVCHGDTAKAAGLFLEKFPHIPLVVLVDFHNDCVQTTLEVARAFGNKLWGIRLDTSESMKDRSFRDDSTDSNFGVCPALVYAVRRALDREGFGHVKIIVSGGFTEEKIKNFENEHVPVDGYGVGSALLKGNNDFTADVVKVDGKLLAKVGRKFQENNRMRLV